MTTIQPAPVAPPTPSEILRRTISAKPGGLGVSVFIMPASDDLDNIPQDPSNALTLEKVNLVKLFCHKTGLATLQINPETKGICLCAGYHHATADLKLAFLKG